MSEPVRLQAWTEFTDESILRRQGRRDPMADLAVGSRPHGCGRAAGGDALGGRSSRRSLGRLMRRRDGRQIRDWAEALRGSPAAALPSPPAAPAAAAAARGSGRRPRWAAGSEMPIAPASRSASTAAGAGRSTDTAPQSTNGASSSRMQTLKAASRRAASAGGSASMPSGLERQTATTSFPSAAASATRRAGSCALRSTSWTGSSCNSTRQRPAASQRMRGVPDAAQGRR